MKSTLLAFITTSLAIAQSFTGTLNPVDPNDVFLVRFTLSAPATVRVQSWGYGGSSSAPGGTNAAGTVIAAGGLDPYISLFSGSGITATFLASNDDGLCPPGTRVSGFCLDPTLTTNLPAGSYTLALSAFENFSFAENLGVGTISDLFINLGSYYDQYSNTERTPRYAFDISGNGLTIIGTGRTVEAPTLSKAFGNPTILVNGSTALTFTAGNPGLTPLTGVAFNDPLPAGLVIDAPAATMVCGGTLTSTATTVGLANATLQPLTTCQFTVMVRGATPGLKNNLTSAINSIEGGAGLPATASIDVYMPPQITSQPGNQTVCAGSTATFIAAAIGRPAPAVQWQVSVANGPFTNIPGATNTTLSITTTAAMNGNRYQAVFTNVAGTATTNVVTLTVNTAPVIILSPVDQTVNEGQPVTFTAAATGQPTPTVQWEVSVNGGPFNSIPGVTATTYTFTAAQVLTKNRYRAVFTNTCGFATTDPAIFINIPFDVFQIRYASNLTQGDSVINISNTGVNGASLTGPGFGGAAGNICVNPDFSRA